MKWVDGSGQDLGLMSHPARGAWVEIEMRDDGSVKVYMSHPARGAWVEIRRHLPFAGAPLSHPARGAWVEITRLSCPSLSAKSRTPQGVRGLKLLWQCAYSELMFVAPRKGCVG